MATIKDVAKEAGVSLGTVSNVLSRKGRVSPERTKRVQEAIQKLGYTPDATARSLKTNRSMSIGVILPNISDPNFAHIFTGIERVLSEQGYTSALYTTSEIPAKENLIIDKICEQRMDGVILVTCQPQRKKAFSHLSGCRDWAEEDRQELVAARRQARRPEEHFNSQKS
jgi:DNA-binding LacI/PurR family transcriptional regulator